MTVSLLAFYINIKSKMLSNFWVIQTFDIAVGAVSLKFKRNWFNLYERRILKTVTLNYAFKIVFTFNLVS